MIDAYPVEEALRFKGESEVVNVTYDLYTLRVSISFAGQDDLVYADFLSVGGFRVLDEGDLNEFWQPEARAAGWLWTIAAGGWFDLERQRSGFLIGAHDSFSEYLVCGINDCVSVIAAADPKLSSS